MVVIVSDMKSKLDEEWILDSACLFHMFLNRAWFESYEAVKQC